METKGASGVKEPLDLAVAQMRRPRATKENPQPEGKILAKAWATEKQKETWMPAMKVLARTAKESGGIRGRRPATDTANAGLARPWGAVSHDQPR